ncbi:uncharacterized protein N7477_004761 [Penicillium maclennaniae]|uniref:uncharacterized protein n=1 Tax=Penicillium maclennaniae TaxID=1343394 RepID=UPI00254170CF|nr:uncharacterized protein N7477_004761 [Penicillium maclennaniae]KAJ5674827.1 hypothetical protein N7477_004761 [Penicillium maclennaniae]
MSRIFGRYVRLGHDGIYICEICDRQFNSAPAIYAHCRNTGNHEWCERCERVFVTEASGLAHLQFSSVHNFCTICDQDFTNYPSLRQHQLLAHSCEKLFTRFSYLLLHIERSGFSVNRIEDLIDGIGRDRFGRHVNDLPEHSFPCENCESNFRRVSSLFQHVEDANDCFYLLRPTGEDDDLTSLTQYILEDLEYEIEWR